MAYISDSFRHFSDGIGASEVTHVHSQAVMYPSSSFHFEFYPNTVYE